MRALILTALAVAFVSCRPTPSGDLPGSAERTAIERAVLACHDQTLAAATALDLDRLFGFVAETDRGSTITNGRLFLTRADTIANTRRGFQGIRSIAYETRERHVAVLCRTAALMTTTGQTHVVTTDGRSFTAPYAHTIVFVLQDGTWRVLHLHASAPIRS